MTAAEATAPGPASIASLLWRLLRYAKPYLAMLGLILVLTVVFSAGRYGRAYLIKPLVDYVLLPAQIAGQVTETPPLESEDPRAASAGAVTEALGLSQMTEGVTAASPDATRDDTFRNIVLIAILIVILSPLALFSRVYLSNWVLGHINMDIQRQVAAKLLAVPLSFHRSGTTGDILSRALNDATSCQAAINLTLRDFVMAVVMVIVGGVALVVISWQLALVGLAMAPIIVGIMAVFSKKVRRGARRRQAQLGEVVQHLTAILSGIKVIKAFRGEALETEAFASETRKLYKRSMKVVKNRALPRSIIEMLNSAMGISLLVGSAMLVMNGYWGLTTGDIMAFSLTMATIYQPIKVLSAGWAQLVDHLASAERFFEVIDAEEEPVDPPDAVVIDGIHEGIRFDHVGFSYGREPVLRDVNLSVTRGEVIAIVGPTGGGKTTLVDLLLRFHDADSGCIEIDGVDIRQIARASLLDQAAVVTQEPFLFDATIIENIRYGRPDASDRELFDAAAAAHVDEFVEQLPEGYLTQVGEFGLHLSGGQRQRITIARAILKNPALLVFDEATSALDAKTERSVQTAINTLRGRQTIFLVAHRLSTIRSADRIVVLERGRVTQVGSHEELFAQEGGLYHELVSLQVEGQQET